MLLCWFSKLNFGKRLHVSIAIISITNSMDVGL